MNADFSLTEHAVDRFVQRIVPGMTMRTARTELEVAVQSATPLREKTYGGQFVWRVESPAMFLVTKRDKGTNVVVTVLSPVMFDDLYDDGPTDEIVAAYERIRPLVEKFKEPERLSDAAKAAMAALAAEHARMKAEIDQWKSIRKQTRDDMRALAGAGGKANQPPVTQSRVERIDSLEKRLARQVKHAELMTGDRTKARSALRAAMAVASRGEPARFEALLADVATFDPAFAAESFWRRGQ